MFHAINTLRNNKVFSSLKVFRDLSLQQTENNRWVVLAEEIEDYGDFKLGDEIEVSYIPQHTRQYKNYVSDIAPHFRLKKKYSSVRLKKTNKLHNIVNNLIYDLLLSKRINEINLVISEIYQDNKKKEFYKHKLIDFDLDMDSINYEVVVKSEDNHKRADILIKFNKKHEIYGKGLCFEIQLSKQPKELIQKRTYDRALLGLSTIWIFISDFEIVNDKLIIKNNNLNISPYLNVLNMNLEKSSAKIIKTYENQGILLDDKIEEFKKYINKKSIINQVCVHCKKGYITVKKGKFGNFLGCTNYPNCKIILNMDN